MSFVPSNVNYTPRDDIDALENGTCVIQELIEL